MSAYKCVCHSLGPFQSFNCIVLGRHTIASLGTDAYVRSSLSLTASGESAILKGWGTHPPALHLRVPSDWSVVGAGRLTDDVTLLGFVDVGT